MHSHFLLVALLPLVFCGHTLLERRSRGSEISSPHSQRYAKSGRPVRRTLKPSLTIRSAPPEVLAVTASENKILECEAGGNPPPTIHWLKDGKRIPQSLYEAIHPTNDDGNEDVMPVLGLSLTRSRLYIDCIGPREEGTYTCVAENSFTKVSRDTELQIVDWDDADTSAICLAKKSFGSPARIHMWTHTRLELMGSDVQLFCRSDGEPQPKITWLGPEDTPLENSEKYQVMENGDLIIRDIEWDDMGGYTCEVINPQGSDSTLTFLYPTQPDKRKSKA